MKWLFYVIVFVYMLYRAVYGKSEHGLTVDPVIYGEEGFLKVGEHKTVNCKALNRNQKVEWIYPNGSLVKRVPGNRIFSQEHYVSAFRGRTPALVLTITKAEVHDTGIYQCRSGDYTKDISVCVIEPLVFVDTLTDVTADVGRSITLSCQAKGDPEPRLVWNRNGEIITDDGSSAKYKVMTKYNIQGFEGLLTITSLEADDSGVYSCVSMQEASEVEDCTYTKTHNITLNINYAPVFESGNETNVYAKMNQEIDIMCSAEGFPTPTYRIFKEMPDESLFEFNQKQITYSEENNQAALTVIANATTLKHRFKCLATNDQGSAEKYITLLKMEKPSKIDEVELFDVDDGMSRFMLSWSDDVNFPVTAIDVQYVKDSNKNRKKTYLRDAAWRRCTQTEVKLEVAQSPELGAILISLSGLEQDASYWTRLRATNEVGVSPWSDPTFITITYEEKDEATTAAIAETPEEPEPESSVDDEDVTDATFYGLFFAGGIFVVAFVCMFAMRMVK